MPSAESWKKLSKAKAAMPNPVKDADAYKYKYATLAQVNEIVDPPLRAEGLECQQWISGTVLHTVVVDCETGESIIEDTRAAMESGDERAKGSSQTYQSRYAKLLLFGLAPEDDDGAAASKEQTVQQPQLSDVDAAKQRLWAALKAYAAKHNTEPDKLLEGVKKRSNYAETAAFFESVAVEFESAD